MLGQGKGRAGLDQVAWAKVGYCKAKLWQGNRLGYTLHFVPGIRAQPEAKVTVRK